MSGASPDPEFRALARATWERNRSAVEERIEARVLEDRDTSALSAEPARAAAQGPRQRLRQQLLDRLISSVESEGTGSLRNLSGTRTRVRRVLGQLAGADVAGLAASDLKRLEDEVVYEVGGMGPLGPLFADPTISDILVNGPNEVWVDRFGRLSRTDIRFDDEEHLLRLLKRLVGSVGRHIDEAQPWVDARLADGSRLHAIIPPLTRLGPVISIRRFRLAPFRSAELMATGSFSPDIARFLEAVVGARLNVVVSGGAAAGKTTLLNVLAGFIPATQRVITIEETAELRLDHPHVIPLEARLQNTEGRGEVSLRRLVANALRMRADRVIVGEVRGQEVFDMLQAMNAGHDGSLTTVHANSPADALRRVENLVAMGEFQLSGESIRDLLGSAFHVIVQMARFRDGSRRVTSVAEVVSAGPAEIGVREIYRFEHGPIGPDGRLIGRHVATGHRPGFLPILERRGYPVGELFDSPAEAG